MRYRREGSTVGHGPRDAALVDLVRTRGESLVRYAFLLTGDVAAAQDVVQDALVKVFVRLRARPQPEFLEAYVRRTIVTVYIDSYRRRRQFTRVAHLLVEDETRNGPDADAADRLDLHAALATLAPQERAAVVLRYFADLPVSEIADDLGLAQGTVKRYLSDGVGKLERRLGPMPTARADTSEAIPVTTKHGGRS